MSRIEPRTLEVNEFYVSDVPSGSAALVGDAAVFNADGNFCATQARCTHRGGAPHTGRTAGFAFEMFYTMGNFVPWRESAWALLYERTSLLADRCAATATDPTAPEEVHQAQQRATALAALLSTHVPASVRPARATP